MPLPRKYQIIPGQPGFFHCINRCVRRAWLCGTDPLSGKNFDHRRDWIINRLELLSECFCIDVYAYAVMSNHTHIVLYVDPDRAKKLTDNEVIRRYRTVWNWRNPDNPPKIPTSVPVNEIAKWRLRLGDVSWFMRALKEPIARIANAEDDCKGAFWESRFKSIPLLDEAGLLACMAYVDLNPIKAGLCRTIADSDYTSVQRRYLEMQNGTDSKEIPLQPVMGLSEEHVSRVPIKTIRYIDLVKRTSVEIHNASHALHHPELERLRISERGWMAVATDFLQLFRTAVGCESSFASYMDLTGRKRRQDQQARSLVFLT